MGKTRYLLALLVLGALVIGLSSPAQSTTLETLGATLSDLKFYESPLDLVPVGERAYSAAFEKQSTRFVAYQFRVESPEPGRQVEIPLTIRYCRPDGGQMVQLDHPVRLQPSWTRSSHSWGFGWTDPGKWPPGRYTVKIFEGTKEVLSNAFTVHTDLEAADLLFNWLEAQFPQILSPGARTTVPFGDLHYRHYTKTNVYLGTAKGDLYFLDERGELHNLGRVNYWLGHVDGEAPDPGFSIADYYPQSGPAGAFIYLLLDRPISELPEGLKAFYNGAQMELSGGADNVIRVVVPNKAGSGNIEIRAGNLTSNTVSYQVEAFTTTQLLTQPVQPASTFQSVHYLDEITVTLPPGFLDKPRTLSIARVNNAPPTNMNPFAKIAAYDVILDDLKQLPEHIRISLPYDVSELHAGYSAEDQLQALRWDEEAELWIPLPFTVDAGANVMHIYTDHLSTFARAILTGTLKNLPGGYAWFTGGCDLYDIYSTPNFRFSYCKARLDEGPLSNANWRFRRPELIWPKGSKPVYEEYHPHSIQDIAKLHEMALDHYLQAGFRNPVSTATHAWGSIRWPITVGIDNLMAVAGGEPSYEKWAKTINLPSPKLEMYEPTHQGYANIGHELFHRMQAEYYQPLHFPKWTDHYWWIEATAEYAGNRIAWGGQQFDHHHADIQPDFLQYPINQTGVPGPSWNFPDGLVTSKLYEYAASVFIEFLVEEAGFDFRELSEKAATGDPLIRLSSYIGEKSGYTQGLGGMYQKFARRAVFSQDSFLKTYPIADFNGGSSSDIAEKKDTLRITDVDVLKIQVTGDNWAEVDVFILPENQRVSGNGYDSPVASLAASQGYNELEIRNVKNGDVVYLLGVNSHSQDQMLTATLTVDGRSSELRHTFHLKGNYSARLWAIKVIKEASGTYQGKILMGWDSRFPPRAFTISGSQITADPETVESFLNSGRYDGVFSFAMLPCTVRIRFFDARGTCTPEGVLKGWYQLSYEYTGNNAARCREMRGQLLNDPGIMTGSKPAFGGELVDFSGQIDSRGYGSVRISDPDGSAGNLDVRPW